MTNEVVLAVTELTLAVLLFSDASTVRLRDVEGDATLPSRLLFLGLPLTMLAGAVVAYLMFPEVGWAAAALLAAILAPTDVALGMAVVTNKAVPVRIRRALERRERPQRRDRDAVRHAVHRGRSRPRSISRHGLGAPALQQIGLAIAAAAVVGYVGGSC